METQTIRKMALVDVIGQTFKLNSAHRYQVTVVDFEPVTRRFHVLWNNRNPSDLTVSYPPNLLECGIDVEFTSEELAKIELARVTNQIKVNAQALEGSIKAWLNMDPKLR